MAANPSPFGMATSLIGLGSDVLSNFADSRDRGWWRGAYVNNLNFGRQGYDDWNRLWQDRTNPVWANAVNSQQYMNPALQQGFNPYQERAGGMYDMIPGLQQQYGQPYFGGGIANSLDQFGEIGDTANAVFQGGGWSEPGQNIMDFANRMYSGQTPGMQDMSEAGRNRLSNRGQSDFTNMVRGGVWNDIANAGNTSLLKNAANYADSIFQTGGKTDFTEAAQQRAIKQLMEDPTLSMEDAISMARNQAATAAQQQSKAARRQALARGGGPGTAVANGLTNQAMADFSDQAMQAEAAAGTNAAMQQQKVLLDELGITSKVGSESQGLENNRLLTALGLFPEIQKAASGQLNAAGNLGLGAEGADRESQSLGGNLLNTLWSNQLGGGNLGRGTLSDMNQYALGAGNLANAANANRGQLALGSYGAGQTGFNNMLQAYLSSIGVQGNALNQGYNWMNQQFIDPSIRVGGQAMTPLGQFAGNSSQLPMQHNPVKDFLP